MNSSTRIMELMDTDFDYPVVSPEFTINQVWQVLGTHCQNNSERLVLVTNKENQLEGVINFETIFDSMEPGDLNIIARIPGGGISEGNYLVDYLLPHRGIKEIMLPVDKIALKSTDTVNKALFILLNNDVGVLPVLNVFKQIIGVVRAADVFYALGLSSSFCKLAFPGYDYTKHGILNHDVVNQKREFNYEWPEQKALACSLHKFNPKIAVIAVLAGLMLSLFTPALPQAGVLHGKAKLVAQANLHHVLHGRDANEVGKMVVAINSMVDRLQDKTVKIPPSIKEISAYGQEMTGSLN